MRTAAAAEARAAVRHDAAGEEGAQLALDETRQPGAVTAQPGLGEERFEVGADDVVKDGLLRSAAHVRALRAAQARMR